MKYHNVKEGIFLERINRFVAKVLIDEEETLVHLKNTGRLGELLIPGQPVILSFNHQIHRKTKWDLNLIMKDNKWVCIDSMAPNHIVKEGLESGKIITNLENVIPEFSLKKLGDSSNSRLDFYYETTDGKKGLIEVKGVTLFEDNVACFPDAPTTRGIKHLEELIKYQDLGFCNKVIFVIEASHIQRFSPSPRHPDFVKALQKASQAGVEVKAFNALVTPKEIVLNEGIEVKL